MEAAVERRRYPRQEQAVVVEIVTERDHGNGRSAQQVVTSNVSPGGLLFQTPEWRFFPVGARVHFQIYLDQPLRCQTWHCSRFSGRGRVVRHQVKGVIDDGDWQGVAVAFEEPVNLR